MSQADKSIQLLDAIDQLDRKLARKLILEDQVKVIGAHQQSLNAFLRIAVQSRDAPLVSKLLELKPNLNTYFGARILWIVAEDGDTEIATMLVRAGANVNINKPYKPNFLHVFAASSNPKKLELAVLMMEYGANLTVEDENGRTALRCAIQYGNVPFAKELLKRNALIEMLDVHEAVLTSNSTEWIMLFVDDYPGNEITKSERIGNIFQWLCDFDYVNEKIVMLLNVILEVEVPNISVLFRAVRSGKIFVVKTILDSCRIDTETKYTLLHPAVVSKSSSVAEMFIEWGADINYRSEVDVHPFPSGVLPIHLACACQSEENIKLLLRLGADINDPPSDDQTTLSIMLQDDPNLNAANRLVIAHLAFLVTEGTQLNDKDIDVIHANSNVLQFYNTCLKELEDMKEMKVLNQFTFYSILTTGMKKLSLLTKRQVFAENCNRKVLFLLFPLYYEELNWRISRAEARRDLLSDTEETLFEELGSILPNLVIEKIMDHLYYSDVYLKVV